LELELVVVVGRNSGTDEATFMVVVDAPVARGTRVRISSSSSSNGSARGPTMALAKKKSKSKWEREGKAAAK
jgi:hypothetical protein